MPEIDASPPETPEEIEQVRRSIAMLPPGSWAMRREPALAMLSSLLGRVRSSRDAESSS